MKTTFSRQFALIAALLLVCMIFTGVSFRFLMLGYLKNDKKETLSADAAAVASLAEAYDSTGELEENWDFRLSLSLFSDVGEAEALVCDENGFVVLCSCDEFNCEHIGQQVDANLITEIDASGETFRVGTLAGIHDGRRYIAGRPIVANDTEETIGYVIISSDMTQITDFMRCFSMWRSSCWCWRWPRRRFCRTSRRSRWQRSRTRPGASAVASWIPA